MRLRLLTAAALREKVVHYRELAAKTTDPDLAQLYRDFSNLLADQADTRVRDDPRAE